MLLLDSARTSLVRWHEVVYIVAGLVALVAGLIAWARHAYKARLRDWNPHHEPVEPPSKWQ